jgi:hypothetical protein
MIRTTVVVVDGAHRAYTRYGAQTKGRITERESEGEKLGLMKKKEEVERRACIGLV